MTQAEQLAQTYQKALPGGDTAPVVTSSVGADGAIGITVTGDVSVLSALRDALPIDYPFLVLQVFIGTLAAHEDTHTFTVNHIVSPL